MRTVFRVLAPLVAAWWSLVPAAAQDSPRPAGPPAKEIELVLHPAEVPRPAMEIQLLPPLLEQRPGNAAPLYMKAFLLLGQVDVPEGTIDRVASWLEMPPADVPREEARRVLERFHEPIHYAEMAARRSRCDWELPIREERNLFELMLPEVASARNLARVLALRAKLRMAEGDYGGAIRDLQTGYAMARHVAQQPTLVSGLVGLAIAGVMTDRVETLIQSPGVPNLYWTITALPSPMIDLGEAFEFESAAVYLLFPAFEEALREPMPPEHWHRLLRDMLAMITSWKGMAGGEPGPPPEEIDLDKFVRDAYPIAKRELAERHKHQERERRELAEHIARLEREIQELEKAGKPEPAEEIRRHVQELRRHAEPRRNVEEMTPAEVVVRHVFATYAELRDDMFKWFHVPYWQARAAIERAEQRLREAGTREVLPLASTMLPAIGACHLRVAEAQRRAAALRVIEAIRLYAARHDGRLPDRLDEIEELPLPINPVTGRPFEYRREGDAALLVADGPEKSRCVYRLRTAR